MLSPNVSLEALVAFAGGSFKNHFGTAATIFVAAPGRLNLIGEHIDYCDGFVLPLAIERAVVIAAAPNDSEMAKVMTELSEEEVSFCISETQGIGSPKWSNYLRGVVQGFHQRRIEVPGFDAFIVSSLPGGAGLSSSAALECAVATLLEVLTGKELSKKDKALLAQKAEHDFAGVPCGIMDQYASVCGRKNELVLIDCRSNEVEMVPFSREGLTMLIANTKVSHELSDGGYAARRKSMEDGLALIGKASWRDVTAEDLEVNRGKMDETTYVRARHVVGEIARVMNAVTALKGEDFLELGRLMYESHDSLRDDFAVSCVELDHLVAKSAEIGSEGGVMGARMTGGGFGGSAVILCEADKAVKIATELGNSYEKVFGFLPEIFASHPAEGARQLHS